jgi:hypothetical protein
MICPSCGHTWTPAKRARTGNGTVPVQETTPPGPEATTAEVFAYYKRTAPRADILFALERAPVAAAEQFAPLLASTKPPTAADARRVFEAVRSWPLKPNTEDQFWAAVRRLRAEELQAYQVTHPKAVIVPNVETTWPPLGIAIDGRSVWGNRTA